jgi:hypothetical protein
MAARVTIKAVNDELARLGHQARLEKASGYFYFCTGDAADWIDRTVRVEKISALTLEQWIAEYKRLKKVNAEMMRSPKAAGTVRLRPFHTVNAQQSQREMGYGNVGCRTAKDDKS